MIPTIYSEDFLTDYATVDCESPDRVWMIHSRIANFAEFIEPEPCEIEDLLLCHSDSPIKTVRKNRTVHMLEGGYYIPDLGINVRAFLEGMQETCL